MKLKVIGTGSAGNAYLLETDKEILMIECGVKATSIKQALNFQLNKVVGCIVTHEHNDHFKSALDVMKWGIDVYASEGTFKAKKLLESTRAKVIRKNRKFKIGKFEIIPFDVKHDAVEPLGFLINHPECGLTLFLTDTYYVEYLFPGLNNIIIEANYCEQIINEKMGIETDMKFLRDRVYKSHFNLKNCKELLSINDLSNVNNIVLIHLSDSNSDEKRFKSEVSELTGKSVTVAFNGLEMEFNKTPF